MTTAAEWMAAGCEALRIGKPRHAARAFEHALAANGDRERLRSLRAHTALALVREEALVDAIVIAEELLAEAPGHPIAIEVMAAAGARVGRFQEAVAAVETLVARGAPEARITAARLYERLREDARAIAHATAAPSLDADLVCARVEGRRGNFSAARDAIARAVAAAETARLADIAQAALVAGAPDEAERIFRRIDDASARGWLAEIALWRLALDEAEALAQAAGPSAQAFSVLGGIHVLRGDLAGALPHLDRALALRHDDTTARHWRGEALRRLGRLDEALEDIDLAIAHSEDYFLTASASRALCVTAKHTGSAAMNGSTFGELLDNLAPLAGAPPERARAGDGAAIAAHLESAIRALGGNRSPLPTRLDGGMLVPVPVRLDSRRAARYHQERIRSRPLEDVLAGFEPLFAEYGELPTIHCHRGEIELWLGRWRDAQRSFARALEIDGATRWAWIGLGAALLGAGELDEAARTYERALVEAAPPGRTIFVYRGELAFLRGRLDEAAHDLELSLAMNPERLSAHLLLGRVDAARGDHERCRTRIAAAMQRTPLLLRDVADAGATSDPDTIARVALAMMRGNRSASFVTYFTARGVLRFVPPPRIDAVRLTLLTAPPPGR